MTVAADGANEWAPLTPPRGLADVAALLATGAASPREVLDACVSRLGAAQAHGAFVVVDEDGARRAAAALPRRPRGPLHGVPVAVKDLIDVAGLPTALGRAHGRVAAADAAIVARLRAAGAIVLGKTRTDELGLGALTPGASDPRDATRSPGGSSGGSAIAVAVGAVPLALATDTAGSARIPAAACGVSGLCAAPDWISATGVSILAPSFDRLGLIAATPRDLAVAWTAFGGAVGTLPERVVTLADEALGRVEPERITAAREAALRLSARPVELAGPSLPAFGAPRAVLITAEAAARHRAETPAAQAQLAAGAAHARADVRAARARLDDLGAALRVTVGEGVLVIPTLPARPPRWDEVEDTDAQLRATGRLTRLCGPVNGSGLVAVSAPSGVQLVARRMETALAAALRVAA
jgi:aspartyl-tRNA(Asn)/glutamyl-tRNA(Gln) amidotransferase subunit A